MKLPLAPPHHTSHFAKKQEPNAPLKSCKSYTIYGPLSLTGVSPTRSAVGRLNPHTGDAVIVEASDLASTLSILLLLSYS